MAAGLCETYFPSEDLAPVLPETGARTRHRPGDAHNRRAVRTLRGTVLRAPARGYAHSRRAVRNLWGMKTAVSSTSRRERGDLVVGPVSLPRLCFPQGSAHHAPRQNVTTSTSREVSFPQADEERRLGAQHTDQSRYGVRNPSWEDNRPRRKGCADEKGGRMIMRARPRPALRSETPPAPPAGVAAGSKQKAFFAHIRDDGMSPRRSEKV